MLLNEALPPDLRDYSRVWDNKGSAKVFQDVAEKHPEKYVDIAKKIQDIGRSAATESGGYSFGIDSLRTPPKTAALKKEISANVDKILRSNIPDEEKQKTITSYVQSKTKLLEDTLYREASEAKNPLAMQVMSGARGKPGNLRSVLAGDLLYEDHRGDIIPIPVMNGYAKGLSPVEYWAGTFGTRRGVYLLKAATADAGFFGKQLNQITHRLIVTKHDREKDDGIVRGVPYPTDDPHNEGALLSVPAGGYKRDTILTPKILADIKAKGVDNILLRSPLTGGPEEGGLYAKDVGIREKGGYAPIGDAVGQSAAQVLAEVLIQGSISSKHSGGVAGAGHSASGFKAVNQLVQVPKTFTGGASHAQLDGKVGAIYDAPAGGKFLMIGGQRHYISTGLEPKVKYGDDVEAGDVLSEGMPNPSEIVHHKGIGEGRRYFVDILRNTFKDSNFRGHRRNMELLSRGLINHVKLHDEMGDYVPDDIVPYDTLEHVYQPRDGHSIMSPSSAIGKYLEKPILHYSIGTQIKPSMLKHFKEFGIDSLTVHKDPPPFEPHMVRAMENLVHDPDWMTRQFGSNLSKGLLSGVHRGLTSDEEGTSFVPALARSKDYGRVGLTKTWNPKSVLHV
jgi:hypothetical protein